MASITCGACKGTHSSAIMVRNCYGKLQAKRAQASTTTRWAKANQRSFGANETRPTVTAQAVRLATDKQINYIADLMVKLSPEDYNDRQREIMVESMTASRQAGSLTFEMASATIDSLKGSLHDKRVKDAGAAAPAAKAPRSSGIPDVAAGRYAVEHKGVLKFYRVDRPTEGRWAGRTFLKVQASDELHDIRDAQYRFDVLSLIARDPHAAMIRYGHELGVCGKCGRTLTDETSRANGIGPVCAANL